MTDFASPVDFDCGLAHCFSRLMAIFRYDDPTHSLFRVYGDWECDDDGYPFIWDEISECRRAEKLYRCEDCGFAYLEDGDILTVHHFNRNKADCRRRNLDVYCWLCHSVDHEPDFNMRDLRCKYCEGGAWFLGSARLHRHIRGIHRPFELKIPEIQLDKPPVSFVGRGKVWMALQKQQLWWD